MLNLERLKKIGDEIKKNKVVTVKELASKFTLSEATIRRDLERLERSGIVKRTYGGAILQEGLDIEIPLEVRQSDNKSAKDQIGMAAARLVSNNSVLLMDSSSTVLSMIPYLRNREGLTVITNGAKTAVELGNLMSARVYSTGGLLRENSLSYIGETAKLCVENFYTDLLFFSCRSVSIQKGLTDISQEEAELRRIMIKNAKKTVFLCDSSKLNTISFCNVCGFEAIDVLVTDEPLSSEWESYLRNKDVDIIIVEKR